MPKTIIVYSKPDCPWCDRAKALLDSNGIPYVEKSLPEQAEREVLYDRLKLEGSSRTVPQITVNGDAIGGFMSLTRYIGAGAL